MNIKEVADLFNEIQLFYPQRFTHDDPAKALKAWHKILSEYDTEKVRKNLDAHVIENKFPPTIADLTENAKIYVRPKSFVMDFEEGEDWPL